jgi:hypothetical protein
MVHLGQVVEQTDKVATPAKEKTDGKDVANPEGAVKQRGGL